MSHVRCQSSTGLRGIQNGIHAVFSSVLTKSPQMAESVVTRLIGWETASLVVGAEVQESS